MIPIEPSVSAGNLAPAVVEHANVVARHRDRRRAELHGEHFNSDRVRRDGPSGFGLPPMVDDRHAQMLLSPFDRVGVGALPGKKQGLQARQIVVLYEQALEGRPS